MNKPKALFILKRRDDYSTDLQGFTNYTVATGMYNSAKFVADMLKDMGIDSKVVIVIDNNDINREVTVYKPTHVFIEGLWVVPDKFDVLKKLHPNIKQVVRIHSELPFIAQEGVAMDWIFKYLKNGIRVACNSERMLKDIRLLAFSSSEKSLVFDTHEMIPLLKNYYPVPDNRIRCKDFKGPDIHIGCFGAFRQFKNHLTQAIAAIEFAERYNFRLVFHINTGRIEQNGNNPYKNVKAVFSNLPQYKLVEHKQTSHENFIKIIQSMDICMQVSFSETFNIVAADCVTNGVPVVISSEISQMGRPYADPTSTIDIVDTMHDVWLNRRRLVERNYESLEDYSYDSRKLWKSYMMKDVICREYGLTHALLTGIKNIFR